MSDSEEKYPLVANAFKNIEKTLDPDGDHVADRGAVKAVINAVISTVDEAPGGKDMREVVCAAATDAAVREASDVMHMALQSPEIQLGMLKKGFEGYKAGSAMMLDVPGKEKLDQEINALLQNPDDLKAFVERNALNIHTSGFTKRDLCGDLEPNTPRTPSSLSKRDKPTPFMG